MAWSTTLSTMLRVEGAPDSLIMLLLDSMVVTQAATSIGRDKFHLQILNTRFREIEDSQNSLVIHTVVSSQKQHALFCGPAPQDLSHTRGQFVYSDFLAAQCHETIRRQPLVCRKPDDGAACG